jgi:hypothetical protein
MEELLAFMESFERKNNISLSLEMKSDGSGIIKEVFYGEKIKSFNNYSELSMFLATANLKMEISFICQDY